MKNKNKTRTILVTVMATILGAVFVMNFATPEKKLERKIEHKFSVKDPQFHREMSVLLGPSIIPGNLVTDLQNGDEIFPAMLEAVSNATETITFETYIYWAGQIGKEFADALAERAQAGVSVKVIIDWAGSAKLDDELLKQLASAGVEVQKFHPLKWYNLGRLNNRTHRKLLTVDGKIGFTGGVGIADLWLGDAQDANHWRDMHFKIEGPVVAQIQAAFNDNWIKITGQVLNGEHYFPAQSKAGDMNAHMFIASPAGGSESMHLMYLMSIAAARQSIDLEAAYFVPDELIVEALISAANRGVRVRIIVPGDHIDSEIVRLASKADWASLLQEGIEIFEYQKTMMHNKILIVDEYLVSVGSTNFDIRSFRLNDEASLNIYDETFARNMASVFEKDMEFTKEYTFEMWKDRPLAEKFSEIFVLPLKAQL